MKKKITHRFLCIKGADYLRTNGIHPYHKCKYSVCELELIGECPDAFGWGSNTTQMLEIKVTRRDFLKDKDKLWRQKPEIGLGRYRSYLCPENLIKESDLPKNWGLLYWVNGKIKVIVKPKPQESNSLKEINAINSVLRREGIKSQTFSYKKYKNEL